MPEVGKKVGMIDRNEKVSFPGISADTKVCYTLDGKTPNPASSAYTGEFQLEKSSTVKTIAYQKELLPSAITAINYKLVDIAFDSGTVKTGDEAKTCKVSVKDAKELRLLTDDVDLPAWDFCTWGGAKLTALDGKEVQLSSLEPAYCFQVSGKPGMNKSTQDEPLRIGSKEYAYGIGTLAPSDIRFALNGKYDTFEASVGIDPKSI